MCVFFVNVYQPVVCASFPLDVGFDCISSLSLPFYLLFFYVPFLKILVLP